MRLEVHVTQHAGQYIATVAGLPGCHGTGPDRDTAVQRLQRAVRAYTERPPPSPFASVRKRLSERMLQYRYT